MRPRRARMVELGCFDSIEKPPFAGRRVAPLRLGNDKGRDHLRYCKPLNCNEVPGDNGVMKRRSVLAYAGVSPFLHGVTAVAAASPDRTSSADQRVRPSDPTWPGAAGWEKLSRDVGGHLIKLNPLIPDCANANSAECLAELMALKNPYYVGDQPAGTQSVGWADAWMSAPSVYAVAARTTADVVAGVNFARENNLRLVVKGGGHPGFPNKPAGAVWSG